MSKEIFKIKKRKEQKKKVSKKNTLDTVHNVMPIYNSKTSRLTLRMGKHGRKVIFKNVPWSVFMDLLHSKNLTYGYKKFIKGQYEIAANKKKIDASNIKVVVHNLLVLPSDCSERVKPDLKLV